MKTTQELQPQRVDRSDWPAGPWDAEPDYMQWKHEETGFPLLMVRNHALGHWCGYVGVNEFHPWFKVKASDIEASAHGGLNYANHCEGPVCHKPEPCEDDHVWWVGFDCIHAGDTAPGMVALHKLIEDKMAEYDREYGLSSLFPPDAYRDMHYVIAQCEDLARQAKEATDGSHN